MDKPQSVKQAIIGIWISLLLSGIMMVVQKISGVSSQGEFLGNLIMLGLLFIFPYKISNGINSYRYIYTVLTIIGYLFMIGTATETSTLEKITNVICLPIDIFVIYKLFCNDSDNWFSRQY